MLCLASKKMTCLRKPAPARRWATCFGGHWIPALLSEEIPSPDCPPVRVTLLSEKLIAFRDSNGNPGLVDSHCPHRGAPLFFGRNEESGIRCVYHGWKFDVTGACVDLPNSPEGETYKDKVAVKAYPCWGQGRHDLDLHGSPRTRSLPSPASSGWTSARTEGTSASTTSAATTSRRWRATTTRRTPSSFTAPWTTTRATPAAASARACSTASSTAPTPTTSTPTTAS